MSAAFAASGTGREQAPCPLDRQGLHDFRGGRTCLRCNAPYEDPSGRSQTCHVCEDSLTWDDEEQAWAGPDGALLCYPWGTDGRRHAPDDASSQTDSGG